MPRLDLTPEWLEEHIERAKYCSNATIPGDHFRALVGLAMRAQEYDASGLDQLRKEFQARDEVKLTGSEFRALLTMAKRSKKRQLKPRLRVVRLSTE